MRCFITVSANILSTIYLHLFFVVNHLVLYHRLQILTCFIYLSCNCASFTGPLENLPKQDHTFSLCLSHKHYVKVIFSHPYSVSLSPSFCYGYIPCAGVGGGGVRSLWLTPHKVPCTLTKINMAAVILSVTVFGEQYLKHPTILPDFIWRIHRHTTGMSHKHRDSCGRGLPSPHLRHLALSNQEKHGSFAGQIFFFFISGSAFTEI